MGKAHGVQSADLYGCLYFYLTKQLRSFAERIKKFRILFRMFDQDARELAKNIRTGVYEAQGLMKSMAFDRIDVSNIIDLEYVGVANVLTDWTPFLSKTNKFSTILGYSMNWVPKQHNSDPGENSNAMSKITKKLMEMGKVIHREKSSLSPTPIFFFSSVQIPTPDAFQHIGSTMLLYMTTLLHLMSIWRSITLTKQLGKWESSANQNTV